MDGPTTLLPFCKSSTGALESRQPHWSLPWPGQDAEVLFAGTRQCVRSQCFSTGAPRSSSRNDSSAPYPCSSHRVVIVEAEEQSRLLDWLRLCRQRRQLLLVIRRELAGDGDVLLRS